jgi:hypothetical protein
MSESFSFDKKRRLADRIQKLTDKKDLMQVKKIIVENNPDLPFMKNSNGYFMQFHDLSTESYIKLGEYMDKKDEKKRIKDIESDLIESSELLSEVNEITNDASDNNISKKLRLTNTESHILNRVRYEKELKKNENNSEEEITYFNCDSVKTKNNKSIKKVGQKSSTQQSQEDIFVHNTPNVKKNPAN